MVIINEPFKKSSKEEKIFDEKGKPIPIFSASRFSSCDWNHYADITPRLTKPITDALSEIFDKGNEVHREEEYLKKGARNILECENYMRIIHKSSKWGIAGLLDFHNFDFAGQFIIDLKSTKFGGFYFFLREGVNNDNILQMSLYAYMKYVITGVWINKGVITKIDKENHRNRLSLECDLFTIDKVREYVINHPIVNVVLGLISEEQLIESTTTKIRPEIKGKKEYWKCLNCGYATGDCPVRQQL